MRVLDACAAPGGKTAHLLETAAVELTALDRDPQRLQRVRENLERLRLRRTPGRGRCSRPATAGGTGSRSIASCSMRRAPPRAWCGAIPTSSGCAGPRTSTRLAREQARLLDALWQTLAPGGKLLYVTCSVFPAENQAPIADFLSAHKTRAVCR